MQFHNKSGLAALAIGLVVAFPVAAQPTQTTTSTLSCLTRQAAAPTSWRVSLLTN
jgi:hypothetical protein